MSYVRVVAKITSLIGLSLIILLGSPAWAKHATKKQIISLPISNTLYGPQNLASSINSAINSVDPGLNIGIAVKSMKTGEILYTHHPQRPFVPASILKIITAETALLYLGADYKFQTNFYTDATVIKNGVLYGNLYLVHSGDPTLTYYDLIELMAALKGQNIDRIEGNIYIDTSAYDQVHYGPGWIWKDKNYCYAAPISASIINHNCLSFLVAPNKKMGNTPNALPSPRFFLSSIQNSPLKTAETRSCYIRLGSNPNNGITISDCLPKGKTQEITTVVSDIIEYNKALLRALFRSSNIQVMGGISPGLAPALILIF